MNTGVQARKALGILGTAAALLSMGLPGNPACAADGPNNQPVSNSAPAAASDQATAADITPFQKEVLKAWLDDTVLALRGSGSNTDGMHMATNLPHYEDAKTIIDNPGKGRFVRALVDGAISRKDEHALAGALGVTVAYHDVMKTLFTDFQKSAQEKNLWYDATTDDQWNTVALINDKAVERIMKMFLNPSFDADPLIDRLGGNPFLGDPGNKVQDAMNISVGTRNGLIEHSSQKRESVADYVKQRVQTYPAGDWRTPVLTSMILPPARPSLTAMLTPGGH